MSFVNVKLELPTFPARSVSVTTTVCEPSASAVVAVFKLPVTVAPSICTTRVTPALLLRVSVASFVILSVALVPLSAARTTDGAGAVVSFVKVRLALPTLPAASVSVTTTVCAPSASAVVAVFKLPVTVVPSICTTRVRYACASSMLSVASLVTRLPFDVSLSSATVGAGGIGAEVSIVTVFVTLATP